VHAIVSGWAAGRQCAAVRQCVAVRQCTIVRQRAAQCVCGSAVVCGSAAVYSVSAGGCVRQHVCAIYTKSQLYIYRHALKQGAVGLSPVFLAC
jgi:hypothetical protein